MFIVLCTALKIFERCQALGNKVQGFLKLLKKAGLGLHSLPAIGGGSFRYGKIVLTLLHGFLKMAEAG